MSVRVARPASQNEGPWASAGNAPPGAGSSMTTAASSGVPVCAATTEPMIVPAGNAVSGDTSACAARPAARRCSTTVVRTSHGLRTKPPRLRIRFLLVPAPLQQSRTTERDAFCQEGAPRNAATRTRALRGRTLGPSPGYPPRDQMTSRAGIRCRPPGGRLLLSPGGLPPSAKEPDIMAMPTRETAVTTIEERLALPDDGKRHELLDGLHVVTPAPEYPHQGVLGEFSLALGKTLEGQDELRLLSSPADIVLSPRTLVQ